MIKATIVTPSGVSREQFGTIEQFVGKLAELRSVGGQIVVRTPDDESFLAIGGACALSEQEAERATQLITGSRSSFWRTGQVFADGDGWRMILVGLTKVSEAAGAANGLRRQG